jgi:hypothetical protein
MVRAYAYALGREPKPTELDLNEKVKRWGVEAVFGKSTLTVREMRDMDTAESASTMIQWFKQRERSENWSAWEAANPDVAKFLNLLHKDYLTWQTR